MITNTHKLNALVKQIYATAPTSEVQILRRGLPFDCKIEIRPDGPLDVVLLSPRLILPAYAHPWFAFLGYTCRMWCICFPPERTNPRTPIREIDWINGSVIHLDTSAAENEGGRLNTLILAATLPRTALKYISTHGPICLTLQHQRQSSYAE